MSFAQLAFCFASATLGAIFGVQLLFWLAKPRARVALDLTFRKEPMCPECGKAVGTKQFLEPTKASDEFDVTMRQ